MEEPEGQYEVFLSREQARHNQEVIASSLKAAAENGYVVFGGDSDLYRENITNIGFDFKKK